MQVWQFSNTCASSACCLPGWLFCPAPRDVQMQGGFVENPLWEVCVSQSLTGNYISLKVWVPGRVFKASPRTSSLRGLLLIQWDLWAGFRVSRKSAEMEDFRKKIKSGILSKWQVVFERILAHTGEGGFWSSVRNFGLLLISASGCWHHCWEISYSCVKLILLRIPYLCSTNVRSWKGMFLTLLQGYFNQYNLFQKKTNCGAECFYWVCALLFLCCSGLPAGKLMISHMTRKRPQVALEDV